MTRAVESPTDAMLKAILNLGKSVEAIASRLDTLEKGSAPPVVEVIAEPVKRGRGRPKGSTNKATAPAVTALPMPKSSLFKLTAAEARAMANQHYALFPLEKEARKSLRSAIGMTENGEYSTIGEMIAAGSWKVGAKSGKSFPHYVAGSILKIEADLNRK